jgi:hypothetical protein
MSFQQHFGVKHYKAYIGKRIYKRVQLRVQKKKKKKKKVKVIPTKVLFISFKFKSFLLNTDIVAVTTHTIHMFMCINIHGQTILIEE